MWIKIRSLMFFLKEHTACKNSFLGLLLIGLAFTACNGNDALKTAPVTMTPALPATNAGVTQSATVPASSDSTQGFLDVLSELEYPADDLRDGLSPGVKWLT